jgi:hypothetical protein
MPNYGSTTDENHVAQTTLFAVCGFSSPNWPKAADLPERQEVCATRPSFHRSCHTARRGVMSVRNRPESPLGRGKGRQALGWVVTSTQPPRLPQRRLSLRQPPLPRRGIS